MRVLKKAEQRNVVVDKDMYTEKDLKLMEAKGFITSDKNIFAPNEDEEAVNYRVFLDDCKDIKVIYNEEFGFYANVVTLKTGEEIYINL